MGRERSAEQQRPDQPPPTPRPADDSRSSGRLPAAERRQHLLDVATDVIVESGIEALTMEGLAARAGVSKGLGYAYFANSDDIVVALFAREMAELDRRIAEATAGVRAFEDRIRAMTWAMFDMVVERGVLLGRLLQRPSGDTPVAAHQARRDEVVQRYFRDLVTEEFDLEPSVAQAAVTILLAGSTASIDLWVRQRMPRRAVVDVVVALTMGGLRELAGPGAARPGRRS